VPPGAIFWAPRLAPPVTNEKGDSSYAEQQHRKRSQAVRCEVGEIGEGILGRINGIVEDGYLLSDVGLFLPWTPPPAVGLTVYRKAVAVPIVIRGFVGGDRTVNDRFPLGDCAVNVALVDRQATPMPHGRTINKFHQGNYRIAGNVSMLTGQSIFTYPSSMTSIEIFVVIPHLPPNQPWTA